jgi:hypothetical protein
MALLTTSHCSADSAMRLMTSPTPSRAPVGSTVDLSPNRGCAAGSSPGLPPCWPLWRMVGAGRADRCLYAATDTRHRGHERGRGQKTPKHPQFSEARYLGTPVALEVGQRQRVQRETFNVFLDAVHLTRSWTSLDLCSRRVAASSRGRGNSVGEESQRVVLKRLLYYRP